MPYKIGTGCDYGPGQRDVYQEMLLARQAAQYDPALMSAAGAAHPELHRMQRKPDFIVSISDDAKRRASLLPPIEPVQPINPTHNNRQRTLDHLI